jgi:hypothetical protein
MNLSFRTKMIAGVAVIVALAVCGWSLRRSGIAIGKLGERVVETRRHVDELRPVVAAAAKAADVETKKLVAKNSDYRAARAKVEVKGDSVIADGQRVELASVAAALVRADSLSIQVAPTVVKQAAKDTANLVFYHAVDAHDSALEQEKEPWCGRKCGVAIGVGTTVGVVYVAVRIIARSFISERSRDRESRPTSNVLASVHKAALRRAREFGRATAAGTKRGSRSATSSMACARIPCREATDATADRRTLADQV